MQAKYFRALAQARPVSCADAHQIQYAPRPAPVSQDPHQKESRWAAKNMPEEKNPLFTPDIKYRRNHLTAPTAIVPHLGKDIEKYIKAQPGGADRASMELVVQRSVRAWLSHMCAELQKEVDADVWYQKAKGAFVLKGTNSTRANDIIFIRDGQVSEQNWKYISKAMKTGIQHVRITVRTA